MKLKDILNQPSLPVEQRPHELVVMKYCFKTTTGIYIGVNSTLDVVGIYAGKAISGSVQFWKDEFVVVLLCDQVHALGLTENCFNLRGEIR